MQSSTSSANSRAAKSGGSKDEEHKRHEIVTIALLPAGLYCAVTLSCNDVHNQRRLAPLQACLSHTDCCPSCLWFIIYISFLHAICTLNIGATLLCLHSVVVIGQESASWLHAVGELTTQQGAFLLYRIDSMQLQVFTKPSRPQLGPPTASPCTPAMTAPVLSIKPRSTKMLRFLASTQPISARSRSRAPSLRTRPASAATLAAMHAEFCKLRICLVLHLPPLHSGRRAMHQPAAPIQRHTRQRPVCSLVFTRL